MGTAEMVGSMGLTFFCNRCVEVFHRFSEEPSISTELEDTCRKAINAFESLKWPNVASGDITDRVQLFNTNGEVKSFAYALKEVGEEDVDKKLDEVIKSLHKVLEQEADIEERKETASKLVRFFDSLGDYSFYATRNAIRS